MREVFVNIEVIKTDVFWMEGRVEDRSRKTEDRSQITLGTSNSSSL